MILTNNNSHEAGISWLKLMLLVLPAILLLSACTSTIKQTPLSLQATSDPRFQTDAKGQVWVSGAEYQRLQHRVADLSTALNQLRAQTQVQP